MKGAKIREGAEGAGEEIGGGEAGDDAGDFFRRVKSQGPHGAETREARAETRLRGSWGWWAGKLKKSAGREPARCGRILMREKVALGADVKGDFGLAGKEERRQARWDVENVFKNIWAGFATAGWLDQLNLALGIVGVWLMVKRWLAAFPVGLVAVSVQAVLFWQAKFPADAALQVFYFGSLVWGWWHWVRDRGAAPELPVTRLSTRGWAATLGGGAVATVVWALTVGKWMDAAMPWRDAFIAAFSVAAQVLQVRKQLENWPLWIVVNGVAVASYWKAELAYTAFLYAIYLVMAVAGWRAWARAMGPAAVEEKS